MAPKRSHYVFVEKENLREAGEVGKKEKCVHTDRKGQYKGDLC